MKKMILILLCAMLCACHTENTIDINSINEIDANNSVEVDLKLHSNAYLIARISDLKILYSKNDDKRIFPASLTKLMTLDTVLHTMENLDNTSSISKEQIDDLINQDASLAYLYPNREYSIRDLLYALILPSGADAAVALENYYSARGLKLIDLINEQLIEIGCNNTKFINTTGLHDDNHYSTISDLFTIVMDILKYEDGRKILETLEYKIDDTLTVYSTINSIRNPITDVLGGKTGFTEESGQSVMVLYRKNNRSYILFVLNAMGDYSQKQYWHYEDAVEIMKNLY